MQGGSGPRPFRPNGVHSEEFTFPMPANSDVEIAFREWGRQCDAANEFVARTELDARGDDDVELRKVLVHMMRSTHATWATLTFFGNASMGAEDSSRAKMR